MHELCGARGGGAALRGGGFAGRGGGGAALRGGGFAGRGGGAAASEQRRLCETRLVMRRGRCGTRL